MKLEQQGDLPTIDRFILWRPVIALATLYGSFTLSWVIYRVHLPILLNRVGLPEAFAPTLLLVEALLAIAIEPLAGLWSDRLRHKQSHRLTVVSIGVISASVLFILLLMLPVVFQTSLVGQGLMIVALIAWAIAMSLFRSPALSLLSRYAAVPALPLATAGITLAAGLAGAVQPLGTDLLRGLGTPITFIGSVILLLVTAVTLQSSHPVTVGLVPAAAEPSRSLSMLQVGLVFSVGLTLTLGFRLAIEVWPRIIKAQVPGFVPTIAVGTLLLTSAVVALPLGKAALHWGTGRSLLLGLLSMAILLGSMKSITTATTTFLLSILLGMSYSLVANVMFPVAFALLPFYRPGLAIGSFFAGAAAATSIFIGILNSLMTSSPNTGIVLGIASLSMAGVCALGHPARLSSWTK